MIVDLSDAQARAAMPLKWGAAELDVLPAWVAEMDYALAPVVEQAVLDGVRRGITGYPHDDGSLGVAFAGFAARRYGWQVDPGHVLMVGDVMAGLMLALDVLSPAGGAVVVPTPAYMPFLDVADRLGRPRVDLVLDPDADHAGLDLQRLDEMLAAHPGATVLLSQPHNPWGRVFTRAELEDFRDVVVRNGARVISDEIHAPLTMPGHPHVPYLDLDTADHAVAVVAASKAFNTAGLKCAQLVCPDPAALRALRSVPLLANHGAGPLGHLAAVAAYTHGDAWLDALLERLVGQRDLFTRLVAEQLPEVRHRPLQATYLAWLDARTFGYPDPGKVALDPGRVWVNSGHTFGPGGEGHVRVNLATSVERLTEVVTRLAHAWDDPASS